MIKALIEAITKTPWDSKKICELLKAIKESGQKPNKSLMFELIKAIAYQQDEKAFEILKEFEDFDVNIVEEAAVGNVADYVIKNEGDIIKKAKTLVFLFKMDCDIEIFDDKSIKSLDDKGNTFIHYLVISGDLEAYKIYNSVVLMRGNFLVTNKEGLTPIELAQKKTKKDKEDLEILQDLCMHEFVGTTFYSFLIDYFKKQQKFLPSEQEVERYKEILSGELKRLSELVIIPADSEPDDSLHQILRILNIYIQGNTEDVAVAVPENARRKLTEEQLSELYDNTLMGHLEKELKQAILQEVKEYIKEPMGLIKDKENKHNESIERHDFLMMIKGTNLGIVPKLLHDIDFNKKEERRIIDEEFTEEVLEDLESIDELLEKLNYEDGVLDQMLFDHFINLELITDIIQVMDFSKLKLDSIKAVSILKRLDFQFSNVDLKKPFLLNALLDNLNKFISDGFLWERVEELAGAVIKHIADKIEFTKMVREFNRSHDPLTHQKTWLTLQKVIEEVALRKSGTQEDLLPVEKKLSRDKPTKTSLKAKEATSKKIDSLVKVFPTDKACKLIFKEEEIPLQPIFNTLHSIAKNTHISVLNANATKKSKTTKKSGKDEREEAVLDTSTESTNIVTAVLIFIVSVDSSIKVVNIPLNFDYKNILLSRDPEDGVFKDDNDLEHSVAEDREAGGQIIGKSLSLDSDVQAKKGKGFALNILETFNWSEEEFKDLKEKIQAKDVSASLALDFYLKKNGVTKSSPFFHSERVIFHVLKVPQNIIKILKSLEQELKMILKVKELPKGIIIMAGALVFYSYPNSVCQECSLGFIALQNSYKKGFIQLLSNELKKGSFCFSLDPEFQLTAIGGSYSIFRQDQDGSLIKANPFAKTDVGMCDIFPGMRPGIHLRSFNFNPKKHFYEFTENTIQPSSTKIPYSGIVAMSGSKTAKFTPAKKAIKCQQIEQEVKTMIEQHNQEAKAQAEILSFSNGHLKRKREDERSGDPGPSVSVKAQKIAVGSSASSSSSW